MSGRWLGVPYAKGSDTSEAAAESMVGKASTVREQVFRWIVKRGDKGATCDEAESALRLKHQTCSARFNELHRAGRIEDSGRKRDTRSGRAAVVYLPVLPAAQLALFPKGRK